MKGGKKRPELTDSSRWGMNFLENEESQQSQAPQRGLPPGAAQRALRTRGGRGLGRGLGQGREFPSR